MNDVIFQMPFLGASGEGLSWKATSTSGPGVIDLRIPFAVNAIDPIDAEIIQMARCRVAMERSHVKESIRKQRLGCRSVSEVLDYVDGRLGRKTTLDRVAKDAGLSRAAFARRFRDAVRMSFHQYLMRRRIDVARRLLRDTDLDLAFIAEETGFSSQSHFAGVFRTLAECTPARFREKSRTLAIRKGVPGTVINAQYVAKENSGHWSGNGTWSMSARTLVMSFGGLPVTRTDHG